MGIFRKVIIAAFFFVICLNFPFIESYAQKMGSGNEAELPQIATSTASNTSNPADGTPKVRLCTNDDIFNWWKLERIFETPEGKRSAEFKTHPFQYLLFSKAYNIFGELKSETEVKDKKIVHQLLDKAAKEQSQQYIIDDKGVIFLYQNQVFSHSLICGIFENSAGVYLNGDMVLAPTDVSNTYLLYRKL